MELTKGQRLLARITKAWQLSNPARLALPEGDEYEIEAIATLAGLNKYHAGSLERNDALTIAREIIDDAYEACFGGTLSRESRLGLSVGVLEAYLSERA